MKSEMQTHVDFLNSDPRPGVFIEARRVNSNVGCECFGAPVGGWTEGKEGNGHDTMMCLCALAQSLHQLARKLAEQAGVSPDSTSAILDDLSTIVLYGDGGQGKKRGNGGAK